MRAFEHDSRGGQVSLGETEDIRALVRSALSEDYDLITGVPSDCSLRLVGPAEIEKGGPRILRRHRLRSPDIPLIVLLPTDAPTELVRHCFREGAYDVIGVEEIPSTLAKVAQRAIDHVWSGRSREDEAQRMASELGKRARDLEAALEAVKEAYDQTLVALVTALDTRERETAWHSQRVSAYSLLVGLRIGLEDSDLENLFRGALLHDIGKIGIPDAVLLKPGSFTEEEWEIMRGHTTIGAHILNGISFLRLAADVPLSHHEAWEGGGYPEGLKGQEIPLHARIFAVVDSYDAIRSKRPYKEPKEHDEAVTLLKQSAGKRLDPALVECFVNEPEQTWEQLERNLGGAPTFENMLRMCQEVNLI
jgi:HD-GYP domain-containing protein (c-di-GMP phosphodiesterase class II)